MCPTDDAKNAHDVAALVDACYVSTTSQMTRGRSTIGSQGASLLLSVANPNPAPPPGIPPPTGTAAPPPGTTGDEEAIVDEHSTVIEVMVIHEVPIIEMTMIELP